VPRCSVRRPRSLTARDAATAGAAVTVGVLSRRGAGRPPRGLTGPSRTAPDGDSWTRGELAAPLRVAAAAAVVGDDVHGLWGRSQTTPGDRGG